MDPQESQKEKTNKNPSTRESKFINCILSFAIRYQNKTRRQVTVGKDFIIDFESLAIHPLTNEGSLFILFIRQITKNGLAF